MLSSIPVECPDDLLIKAKAIGALRAAVVGAGSRLALESARQATEHGLIEPVLVGEATAIHARCEEIGWDIAGFRVEPAADEDEAAAVSTALARTGDVAALMKGDIHSDTLMRAVLRRDARLRTDRRLSHVFYMTVPSSNKSLCITDAVVNVLPTVEQKVDIAKNVIELLNALGNDHPKVAVLSASEVATASMPSSMKAAELCELLDDRDTHRATVDGPLAFDLAVSAEAARLKRVESPVAGKADVLLVPNIETGNALFKMMVHFMSASAAGIVLGAKVPIMLTSRADPAPSRLASAALAAIFAQSISA